MSLLSAYRDEDAVQQLAGIANTFLIGERPIARCVDDSVARVGNFGPAKFFAARAATSREQSLRCLQRSRFSRLALIAITLVVDGQAFVSQHIGDMDHYEALHAFLETRRLAAISAVAR